MMIVVGLSLSKPLITLGEFGLGVTWLLNGGFKKQFSVFFSNKIAVLLASIYILTLLGLIYTENFEYALGDVRRKLPLLIFPVFLSGLAPFTKKEFRLLFSVYVGGVLIASFWSIFVLLGGLNEEIIDVRNLSRFNSHIRFGLEICLALFGGFYFLKNTTNKKEQLAWLIAIVWLFLFLFIINLFTGIIVFFITLFILLLLQIYTQQNNKIKFLSSIGLLVIVLLVVFQLHTTITNYKIANNNTPIAMQKYSEDGELLYQDTLNQFKENGYFIYQNIAYKEIEAAWNNRSKFNFNGLDKKNQELKTTLLRFLTSKGQLKTKKEIEKLSNNEVTAIENGIANHNYLALNPFEQRIHKIIWEFDSYNQHHVASGHSVIMRWVYWKNAFKIIKKNQVFGVGTGDVQDAFNNEYKHQKILSQKYYLRAHNQYITYVVSFGIVGLTWFLIFLFYPFIKLKLYKDLFYLSFFCIILLSMLSEDTLETQVGITFFAFFNTILILQMRKVMPNR